MWSCLRWSSFYISRQRQDTLRDALYNRLREISRGTLKNLHGSRSMRGRIALSAALRVGASCSDELCLQKEVLGMSIAVSVVVCTRNRVDSLRRCIQAFAGH